MTTFWLSDFCSLLNSININPFVGEDKNFQFNSLTRLIILLTLLGALLSQESSNQIFLAGAISIFLIVVIYMLTYNSSELYAGGKREDFKYEFDEFNQDVDQEEDQDVDQEEDQEEDQEDDECPEGTEDDQGEETQENGFSRHQFRSFASGVREAKCLPEGVVRDLRTGEDSDKRKCLFNTSCYEKDTKICGEKPIKGVKSSVGHGFVKSLHSLRPSIGVS